MKNENIKTFSSSPKDSQLNILQKKLVNIISSNFHLTLTSCTRRRPSEAVRRRGFISLFNFFLQFERRKRHEDNRKHQKPGDEDFLIIKLPLVSGLFLLLIRSPICRVFASERTRKLDAVTETQDVISFQRERINVGWRFRAISKRHV